jgi:hypothetical protein
MQTPKSPPTNKRAGPKPCSNQNESHPTEFCFEMLDLDSGDLESAFWGRSSHDLDRVAARMLAVRLPRIWRLFDIAAFCHYNFELRASNL